LVRGRHASLSCALSNTFSARTASSCRALLSSCCALLSSCFSSSATCLLSFSCSSFAPAPRSRLAACRLASSCRLSCSLRCCSALVFASYAHLVADSCSLGTACVRALAMLSSC
jgi:hypothetical protein